ncbi:metallophosphoesterase family protein [Paenibacillus sp. MER 78]|uniref:Metallophosphoesterase family protein n=1 Tax=Paenibacillus provencensis TaxID=441151 RepID=A0ABW3PPT0_9BACL|nr:metallophosphoesterase family protein [Paenibacillus sp. MER 78]SFS41742.1 serine/threonine protein phosphatase 1 [Paenibacillus sp. 453mf]
MVISDIHGCYDEFNALLHTANYISEQDKLILLGDYVDRGPNSKEVLNQIIQLHQEYGVVTLKGNHDQLFLDAMLLQEDDRWLKNGGYQTIESYMGVSYFEDHHFNKNAYKEAKAYIMEHYPQHLEFLQSLPYYYETDTHLFVHAGINPFYADFKEQPEEDFIWIRELFHHHPTNLDKPVIFGHTPTVHLHETASIWFQEDKIGIDGACAYGKQLNCLEIAEDGTYQTYSVFKGAKLPQ